MQKKFTNPVNEFPMCSFRLPLKKRLWLKLPYPVRLRIEHKCWLSTVILKHSSQMERTLMNKIRISIARKLAPYYQEIIKLNNPYYDGISAQDFEYTNSARMQAFLQRVSNSPNLFSIYEK